MNRQYLASEADYALLAEDGRYIVTEDHVVALEETVFADFKTALSAIATAHYEAAPATAKPPFIVWSMVDSVNTGLSLNSRSGTARIQIDIYHSQAFGRTELRDSVARWAEAYAKTVSGVALFTDSVTERSFRKGDEPLYRAVVDLNLTWRE
jgi:hypothetical protein